MKSRITTLLSAFIFGAFLVSFANAAALDLSSKLLISPVTALAVVSPMTGSFSQNDKVNVTIKDKGVIGPIYIYLYNPATKSVAATAKFLKASLGTTETDVLVFDLAKTKASTTIVPGNYKIVVCDLGVKPDPACATNSSLTITPSSPLIGAITTSTLFPGATTIVSGSGFNSNIYALVDGVATSLASIEIVSDSALKFKVLPGLASGVHTLKLASRDSSLKASNAVNFTILPAAKLSLTTINANTIKQGDVVTIAGSGMSATYPTTIELLTGAQVVFSFTPTLKNTYAISPEGTVMKFKVDSTFPLGNYSLRLSNDKGNKSSAVSITVTK